MPLKIVILPVFGIYCHTFTHKIVKFHLLYNIVFFSECLKEKLFFTGIYDIWIKSLNTLMLRGSKHQTHSVKWGSKHQTHSLLWGRKHKTHSVLWGSKLETHSVLWGSKHQTHYICEATNPRHTVLWGREHKTHSVL